MFHVAILLAAAQIRASSMQTELTKVIQDIFMLHCYAVLLTMCVAYYWGFWSWGEITNETMAVLLIVSFVFKMILPSSPENYHLWYYVMNLVYSIGISVMCTAEVSVLNSLIKKNCFTCSELAVCSFRLWQWFCPSTSFTA